MPVGSFCFTLAKYDTITLKKVFSVLDRKLLDFLKAYKNSSITLGKLEQFCPGSTTYEDFAAAVLSLEEQGVLKKIDSSGENYKDPSLANKYAIKKDALKLHHQQIKQLQLTVHPLISLDRYYKLSEKEWEKDYKYIKKIDAYLKNKGVPQLPVSMPQRSYELVADEKWLEAGGTKVLERLGVGEQLKIEQTPDPLMLAVAPKRFTSLSHLHLVVENKTTYYALADILCETAFTSLIYGQGWKASANLAYLPKQLNLPGCEHIIYYFGDLDAEGIRIWWYINEKIKTTPAVAFYRALLTKQAKYGKQTQRPDRRALAQFSAYFSRDAGQQLSNLLAEGRYYPQEALSKDELQEIWRNSAWTTS
ncbi:Wadjet anti-phage system protein JetD domain-containing protein [Desulfotruncus arcticus]|uniref:Wadjet anti-phage system protein JetD domain-containing protein n=1 Tax=Desulfotruncus arcticus TaxID=341036 RepID=UPI000B805A46|nr:Wadjet anti-phage system protein JetD domain-containing protein [Desulfotruncus arcticus]